MANKTIYPYGVGGQTPSGIDIVNDLVTGGADKALAAQQGKELNEKLKALWASLVEYSFINGKPDIYQTYSVTMPSDVNITAVLKDANGDALAQPVIEGTDINIVLTPTSGYSVEIGSVKMGGQTLQVETDYTVSESGEVKTISIPHISGNIAVTASAQALFTVDFELDGVTSSDTSAVVSGGSYHTKLGTSNNLYVVDDSSVQVTMGGTDITSQVYADDEINIPNVIGDITIAATAMTYVTNGLVLHLDGKNRGGVPGKWTSLVNYDNGSGFNAPIEFTLSNETTLSNYDPSKDFVEEDDHVSFKGVSKGLPNINSLPVASYDGTIEVAYKNADLASNANNLSVLQNTTYTGDRGCFIAFGSFYLSSVGDTTKNYITNSCTGPSSGDFYIGRYKSAIMLKSDIVEGGFFSLSAQRGGTTVGITNFYRNNVNFTDGDTPNTTGAVMGTSASSTLALMYRINGSNVKFYSIADLYSVRVYNRRLTTAERTQNYKVDLKRYPTVISTR